MKAILLDKNNLDAFVSLEDGTIVSVPLNKLSPCNLGDTVSIPYDSIPCANNKKSNMDTDKLIDFF